MTEINVESHELAPAVVRCVWRVCLQVRTRKMPPQPHPPCEKRRLAESAHRSTIGRLPSGCASYAIRRFSHSGLCLRRRHFPPSTFGQR